MNDEEDEIEPKLQDSERQKPDNNYFLDAISKYEFKTKESSQIEWA